MTTTRALIAASAAERFWRRVNRREADACWEWRGCTDGFGYGMITVQRRRHRTHRLAYLLGVGDIPDGALVCHKCDNPPCCNPAHLWLGTIADNNRDMHAKGRAAPLVGSNHAKGERHGSAKLTSEAALEIRRRAAEGAATADLGHLYGVHPYTIGQVVRRKTWRHI